MSVRQRQQELKSTLSEFYAELDRKWEEAEDLLLSFQVPRPIDVPVKTVEPTGAEQPFVPAATHRLGYVRHFGKWALCYGVTSADQPDELFWMSIHGCSAEQKVEASAAFQALLDEVLEAAEAYSETVLDAVSRLGDSLNFDAVSLPGTEESSRAEQSPAVEEHAEPEAAAVPLTEPDAPTVPEETPAEEATAADEPEAGTDDETLEEVTAEAATVVAEDASETTEPTAEDAASDERPADSEAA